MCHGNFWNVLIYDFNVSHTPTYMLSELVHHKHFILSARVITFVTITQLGFMLHVCMHSKSIFLGECVST